MFEVYAGELMFEHRFEVFAGKLMFEHRFLGLCRQAYVWTQVFRFEVCLEVLSRLCYAGLVFCLCLQFLWFFLCFSPLWTVMFLLYLFIPKPAKLQTCFTFFLSLQSIFYCLKYLYSEKLLAWEMMKMFWQYCLLAIWFSSAFCTFLFSALTALIACRQFVDSLVVQLGLPSLNLWLSLFSLNLCSFVQLGLPFRFDIATCAFFLIDLYACNN